MKTLVRELGQLLNVTEKDATRICVAVETAVRKDLLETGRARIKNFGTFRTYLRKGRVWRRPSDGTLQKSEEREYVRFTPSKGLLRFIRESE